MAFSSSDLLQFPEVRHLISNFAGSDAGRSLVMGIQPHSDLTLLQSDLAEADEAMRYLGELGGAQVSGRGIAVRLRFDQLHDIGPALQVLPVDGARLDGREILDLFRTLEIAGECKAILTGVAARFPLLANVGNRLADLRPLARRWQHAFLPDGSLSDSASVALGRLRRDIEKQKRSIQQSLERFLRSHRSDGTLQEDFVTIRDDRYVVPIVAGQKGRVDGIIHGASGSGRTLFVEPLETIELNNQLVRLREDETREIERILIEITSQLREHHAEISATAGALADLDCIFAKAEFGQRYNAVVPTFSRESRRLTLQRARHPLLETVLKKAGRPIVPISFDLNENRRCLLITGPNTGGKTVAMKTTGLLALMAHAALPVPCDSAEFPLFDDVLADIGDSQSIEESLSSFSGHLLHVKQMLEDVTADSLVLLDELGRATDPEEGGALGVAMLDEFRKSGAFCLASTHLSPLKIYGARTPGVLNASMGFDEATLQPTFELRLGMPGKSAGLDIATRMNMPPELIAHARSVLPRMQSDLQELLSDLHRQTAENERLSREMAEAAATFKRRQAEVEVEAARREQQRQREWARKREELIADFEARALLTVDRVHGLTENHKTADQARRLLSQTRREFTEEAAVPMEPPAELAPVLDAERPAIREGARVRMRDIREPGIVRRILKNGMLEVEAGLLRIQISPDDVQQVLAQQEASLPKARLTTGPRYDVLTKELNLIGQRSEEAMEQLDKFLDSAALASVNRVRIIHGHGMGVLKKAVGGHLATSPHIEKFYAASPEEGGAGATIAELRE